jgi:hypothetical protein
MQILATRALALIADEPQSVSGAAGYSSFCRAHVSSPLWTFTGACNILVLKGRNETEQTMGATDVG